MYKIYRSVFLIGVFSVSSFINAQQQIQNPAQKFSTIKIDDISKENLIIPTYETLVSYAKQKQPVNGIFYNVVYSPYTNKHIAELKDKADSIIPLTTYEFKDGIISFIMTGKKDTQKYTRTTENTGYTQQFSNSFQTQVDFYKNGSIHTIRHFGYGVKAAGYPQGIWYAYSEDGTLLQKIDHDSHFRMNFYDVLAIADSYGSPFIGIDRSFNDIHSYWYILLSPHPEDRTTKERILLIDDETGQIIYSIVKEQQKYLKTKAYDSLNLSKESLKWLQENDKHQVPDEELYKLFRGYQ